MKIDYVIEYRYRHLYKENPWFCVGEGSFHSIECAKDAMTFYEKNNIELRLIERTIYEKEINEIY